MAGLQSELFRIGLSALWYSGVARLLEPLTRGRGDIARARRPEANVARAIAEASERSSNNLGRQDVSP
jgi:hypothetical protein